MLRWLCSAMFLAASGCSQQDSGSPPSQAIVASEARKSVSAGNPEIADLERRASAGDATAQLSLAKVLLAAPSPDPDFARVTQLLLRASHNGLPEATLGLFFLKNLGVAGPEVPEAAELKRQALASGDLLATLYLFRPTFRPGGELDDERTMKLLEDAAAAGHPLAQAKLIQHHYWRALEIATCYIRQEAIRRGEQRRHAGDRPCPAKTEGQRHVAAALRIASEMDMPREIPNWTDISASQRFQSLSAAEREQLRNAYLMDSQKETDAERFRFWRSVARRTSRITGSSAVSPLTALVREHVWRQRDPYTSEIAEGFAKVGDILLKGYFAPSDPRRALPFLEKAASLGDDDAQYQIGTLHRDGRGVAKDFEMAARYFAQAATQGKDDAARALGIAFAKGEGVSKNLVRAYFWLNVASMGEISQLMSSGAISEHRRKQFEDPAYARDLVAKLMKPEEIVEAQRMVRDWHPSPQKGAPPELALLTAGIPSRRGSEPAKHISGTGFYVSRIGHLVTNAHVVADCREIRIKGESRPAQQVSVDASIDLALLRAGSERQIVAHLRRSDDIKLGEAVYAFGYPLSPILGETGNLTSGVVSNLQGPSNNSSLVQITAPIQPGNSGGPLLDSKGHVVGVVVGKLDALKVARATGDIPQNINFAIRVHALRAFLNVNGVTYEQGSFLSFDKRPDEIPGLSGAFTTIVECWR